MQQAGEALHLASARRDVAAPANASAMPSQQRDRAAHVFALGDQRRGERRLCRLYKKETLQERPCRRWETHHGPLGEIFYWGHVATAAASSPEMVRLRDDEQPHHLQ